MYISGSHGLVRNKLVNICLLLLILLNIQEMAHRVCIVIVQVCFTTIDYNGKPQNKEHEEPISCAREGWKLNNSYLRNDFISFL